MILVNVQSGRLPFIHVSSDPFKLYFMCCQLADLFHFIFLLPLLNRSSWSTQSQNAVYCTPFLLIMCPKTLRVLFTKLIKTPAPGIQLLGSRFVSRKISLKHAALSDFTHHLKATEKVVKSELIQVAVSYPCLSTHHILYVCND